MKFKLLFKKQILDSLLLLLLVSSSQYIFSHGSVTYPPSRVWVCYNEIIEADSSNPIPESPACLASYMTYGGKPFYDWNEVARMDGNDMHEELLPDGNLASAGRPDKYGGLDQVRDDWVTTDVKPGPFTVTWSNSAPHQTLYYRIYVTKEGFNPATDPLTWDSLELLIETAPRPAAGTDNIDIVLPQRIGKHVLFSVWQRSLSEEAFYSTSDIDFGSGITESVAPEAEFIFDNGICGGSEVYFDASSSYDANGDAITYAWDFGDGTTAEGVTVEHTFPAGLDSSMVTLTVADGEFSTGTSQTINLVEDENCSGLVCAFDAPLDNALPTVNSSYEVVYVIGDRGPNLESITEFTINWDGNNLHQFDFNFSVAPYYSSFSNSTHSFGQSSPQITLIATGIEGLDGDYYVTVDEGNFVLASISGGYTIYFSGSETAPECDDDIAITTETLRGGTLTASETFQFTVGDGNDDYVSGITLDDNIGDNSVWLISDQSGVIQVLPNDIETFNFEEINPDYIEEEGGERLFIYNLSYNGTISGLFIGTSIIEISGEYELSNAVEVYVTTEETPSEPGTTNCTFDTPRSTPMPVMNYRSYNTDDSQGTGSITVIGENGPDLSPYRKLDIAYTNGGLATFFFQEWVTFGQVNLIPSAVHTFDQINPELTLANTGIDNLDGSYYVTVVENEEFGADFADFVMVSKTGDFTIYFTYSDEAPNCDDNSNTLSVNDNEIESESAIIRNYPNPFSNSTTIEYVLNNRTDVNLEVFNIQGQLVKVVNVGEQNPGNHQINFESGNLSDGMYVYILSTNKASQAGRMILKR